MEVRPKKARRKKRDKPPKLMRADIWFHLGTYLCLFFMFTMVVGAAVSPLRSNAWGNAWIDPALYLALLACIAVPFAFFVRRRTVVSRDSLHQRLEYYFNHHANWSQRNTNVADLTTGDSGWTCLDYVRHYEGEIYIDKDVLLGDHPCGNQPVLIARDLEGNLHLLRFTRAPVPAADYLPDRLSIKLVNHGVVAKPRFDDELVSTCTAKERSDH